MMTTISKCLAVLTTFLCLAFLGVAAVNAVGGPNWETRADQLEDYSFTRSEGENPVWSASRRATGDSVGGTSPLLPQKLADALLDQTKRQRERIQTIEQGNPNTKAPSLDVLKSETKKAEALISADIHAMEAKEDQLRAELAALSDQVVKTTEQISKTALEAEKKHQKAARRREDIYRLRNLIEEIKTDRYRAIEHQKVLLDVLERYRGKVLRLERRNEILKQQAS